jgi:hypothetical protein
MKTKVLAALTALLVVVGLGFVAAPQAQASTSPAKGTVARYKLLGNGKVVPANAETAALVTANPPITSGARQRFLFGSNNVERMLCIRDYTTTGDEFWVPKWAATLWDQASNKFGMVWDDQNGNGSPGESNCISYDDMQSIKVYSYSGPFNDECGEVTVIYNSDLWVISAVVQLNVNGNLTRCRSTQVIRQNTVVSAVGYTLGLRYFTDNVTSSVMNLNYYVARNIAQPMDPDKSALATKYSTS